MAASPPRERRAAIWPWLLMPAIVLLVFYALFRVHQSAKTPAVTEPAPAARSADGS
jgi:type VI protein secretion system component VasF